MRKVLCAAFIACMLALLSVLSVPAVQAKPVTNAGGTFLYQTITPETSRYVGNDPIGMTVGNVISQGTSEISASGAFAGPATDVWMEIDHFTGIDPLTGHINFNDVLTISDCHVGTKSGTLILKLVGFCPMSDWQYSGCWTILYGTGDLSNLSGHGTWTADATGGLPLPVLYEGFIQFD